MKNIVEKVIARLLAAANHSDRAKIYPDIMAKARKCGIEANFLTIQQVADQHAFDLDSRSINSNDKELMKALEEKGAEYMEI